MTIDQAKLDTLLGTAVADLSAGYAGVMVSLGNKLGLYKTMDGAGPLSSTEIAKRSGCAERYVREWLNSQAAGGYVLYHRRSGAYELTPEQAFVFADETSPVFLPSAWQVPASMWFDEDQAIDAFRTGKGVNWGEHDERLFCGVAAFYRNCYRGSLVSEWLPTLNGVEAKLQKGARVADIVCGHGYSTVIMAEVFSNSWFWGFDTHEGSIVEARAVAEEAGVADRVTFEVAKADSYEARGYDLVCFFDCLHDMGNPVGAVRHAAEALTEDRTVMLVEPDAADKVEKHVGNIKTWSDKRRHETT